MKYFIQGKVIRGDGYGKQIGFPTANLSRQSYIRLGQKIPFGVYAGYATILSCGEKYKAGIVIGPMDTRGLPKLEAHLLHFSDDLYGLTLRLELTKFVRPFKKFKNQDELTRAIAGDIQTVQKLLS